MLAFIWYNAKGNIYQYVLNIKTLLYILKIYPRFMFSMEKAMAPHSSTLTWEIPWTEEPGRLPSMGSLIVGHDWVTSLSLFTFMHWRRKWQPTPVFLPGESQGRGSLVAAVYGVAQSRTQLMWLSSSSSSSSSMFSMFVDSQRLRKPVQFNNSINKVQKKT